MRFVVVGALLAVLFLKVFGGGASIGSDPPQLNRTEITLATLGADRPIRIVLLSDTHVIGPEYVPGSESNFVDNESILKTPKRLAEVREAVNAIRPKPDLAVFVGDVVHDVLRASRDMNYYLNTKNGFHVAADLFNGFEVPVFFLWGNHDYKAVCGEPDQSVPRPLIHHLISHFFSGAPYQALDVGPWRLLLLNTMLGPTWEPLHPKCQTRFSSFGPEQLQWLSDELSAGRPSLIFLHHPLAIALRDEDPQGPHPDIMSVLLRHSNVRHVFSGHYHKGFDWQDLYPFPHTTLPAVRYDSDNFFLMELSGSGEQYRILDWAKNRGGARCSDEWEYQGGVEPAALQGPETGDCGEPSAASSASYKLPYMSSLADVPALFNPELSCHVPFAAPFLRGCAQEGAGAACCPLIKEAFKPSSASIFASCLCQPSFWASVQDLFAASGHSLGQVVQECNEQYDALLQYRGMPGGNCPPPSWLTS